MPFANACFSTTFVTTLSNSKVSKPPSGWANHLSEAPAEVCGYNWWFSMMVRDSGYSSFHFEIVSVGLAENHGFLMALKKKGMFRVPPGTTSIEVPIWFKVTSRVRLTNFHQFPELKDVLTMTLENVNRICLLLGSGNAATSRPYPFARIWTSPDARTRWWATSVSSVVAKVWIWALFESCFKKLPRNYSHLISNWQLLCVTVILWLLSLALRSGLTFDPIIKLSPTTYTHAVIYGYHMVWPDMHIYQESWIMVK